jgi:hypothetical protein
MPGNINCWPEFLTVVDPDTQQCTFPFPFFDAEGNRLSPFVAKPTQTNTVTGFVTYLDPEDWANGQCSVFVAYILGGTITEKPPTWDPQPVGPYVYGQDHQWVVLSNGVIVDAADLVQKFIHVGNKAVLEQQAIPGLLFPPPA